MITAEECALWRERLTSPLSCHNAELAAFTLRLLDAVCDKHPGNIRASAAEAEARTLSKMVDWLAHQAWRKDGCDYLPSLKERGGIYCHECPYTFDCSICWRKAASLAVRP